MGKFCVCMSVHAYAQFRVFMWKMFFFRLTEKNACVMMFADFENVFVKICNKHCILYWHLLNNKSPITIACPACCLQKYYPPLPVLLAFINVKRWKVASLSPHVLSLLISFQPVPLILKSLVLTGPSYSWASHTHLPLIFYFHCPDYLCAHSF
jgi:hypothetical protein